MVIQKSQFKRLVLDRIPILDVRAPIEYQNGALPFSENIPLLTDEERALVGTAYKKTGSESAIAVGHQLVSGEIKENRLHAWQNFVSRNPNAVVTCFRGGLRSKTVQTWLENSGVSLSRIEGGYKAMRLFFLHALEQLTETSWIVIAGQTGCGKTVLLRDSQQPHLDLERIANHRGSAFGETASAQPAQSTFENRCAAELIHLGQNKSAPVLIEDESRMIGRLVVPEPIFKQIRSSPVILIEESLEQRVENTFQEYIAGADLQQVLPRYLDATQRISKKLGGAMTAEVLADIRRAQTLEEHKIWIEKILKHYYDGIYTRSLKTRDPKILFCGTRAEVKSFLRPSTIL